mmetsp:Transcript_70181/g.81826  ORF Transcript_70181/g.81826 Transcript_70181/m.81826 type:complete len:441 (-) Transcript_70181:203-1525(-)|eukprot:CAMPEP_0176424776 /NCGR_PEP_ID=MMETSP0127-20121128/11025_1 /TAXON_ID=938130 /ORGANISM="Platyophrya macrostoma, Strain WH" /LENGTH=440 /DNA_ID=CAMNT_0017805871 /DNA_START=83 /DNA_END=1405 /DNA_ORIENTATION=-
MTTIKENKSNPTAFLIQKHNDSNNQKVASIQPKRFLNSNTISYTNQPTVNVYASDDCSVIFTLTTIDSSQSQRTHSTTESSEGDGNDDDENNKPKPLRGANTIKKTKTDQDSSHQINLFQLQEEHLQRNASNSTCFDNSSVNNQSVTADEEPLVSAASLSTSLSSDMNLNIPKDNSIQQAKDLADSYEGNYLKAWPTTNSEKVFEFSCKLGHSFRATLKEAKETWCEKCDKKLQVFRNFAATFNGKVLNRYFDHNIQFQCEERHSWIISDKNAKRRWCIQCRKDEKNSIKEQLQQEHKGNEIRCEEEQKKLFERAIKGTPTPVNTNTNTNTANTSTIERFKQIENEIHRIATKNTTDFMNSKAYKGDCTQEQIMQVYNMLVTPEDILKTYMSSLSVEYLKSEFKRLAKALHPDKNKHPEAASAFQKILKVYEWALKKFES